MRCSGLLLALLMSTLSMPSWAEGVMSEESIRAFYQEMDAIQLKDAPTVVAFYEKHTHPEMKATMYVNKHIPGKEDGPEEILIMNREEMMDRISKVYAKGQLKKATSKVNSITLEDGGQRAKVSEEAVGVFQIPVSTAAGMQDYTSTHNMQCDDVLVLSAEQVIQTIESSCKVNATMSAGAPE